MFVKDIFVNGWYVAQEDWFTNKFESTILKHVDGKWFDLNGNEIERPQNPCPVRPIHR